MTEQHGFSESDRTVLRAYLLCQLQPSEHDEVEEWLATDPAYSARFQEVERALLREYAAGDMPPQQAELFEQNYIVTDRRRQQIALTEALVELRFTSSSTEIRRSFFRGKLIPVVGLAACLVIISLLFLNYRRAAAPVEVASQEPPTSPARSSPTTSSRSGPNPEKSTRLRSTRASEDNRASDKGREVEKPRPDVAPVRVEREPEVVAEKKPPSALVPGIPGPPEPTLQATTIPSDPQPVPSRPQNPLPSAPNMQAWRATITELNWSQVKSSAREVLASDTDVGKGMRTLIAKRLIEHPAISVSSPPPVSEPEVILAGDVIVFGRDDRDNQRRRPATGFSGSGLRRTPVRTEAQPAVVVIHYRLVNSKTGEVLASGEVRGESARKIGPKAPQSALGSGRATDMGSDDFAMTIIGEAAIDASKKLAEVVKATISRPR